MKRRSLQQLAIRLGILAALAGALVDPSLAVGRSGPLPVAIVDVSDSVGGGPPAIPPGLEVQSHWVVVAEGVADLVGGAEAVQMPRGGTWLDAGIRQALARAPGADLLLMTDGRGTRGDALAAARAVRSRGGRLFVRAPVGSPPDACLRRLRIRSAAAGVRISVDVESSVSGRIAVSCRRGEVEIGRRSLAVEAGGVSHVEFEDPSAPTKGARYEVRIEHGAATPDDVSGNDVLYIGWRSKMRRVLVVGDQDALPALERQDLVIEHAPRLESAALAAQDAVVIAGLPWRLLSPAADALEDFVLSGGRLFLLGGPRAWRAGGWGATVLEERLSPLRTLPPEGAGTAMLVLLDRSGSTADGALTHLRTTARRVLLALPAGERLAVLPFSASADVPLDPGWVSAGRSPRQDRLLAELAELAARGETDLGGALRSGVERLAAADAERHVLTLLTDGDPDHELDPALLRSVRSALDARGMSFLALVVGDSSAHALLREHLAVDPRDVQLLSRASDLTARLTQILARRRLEDEVLSNPDGFVVEDVTGGPVPWSSRPWPDVRPTRVHQLELQPGASLVASALQRGPEGVERLPFLALRRVGAGLCAGLAWGPGLELEPDEQDAAHAYLLHLVKGLADSAERGLAGEWSAERLRVVNDRWLGRGALAWTLPSGVSGTLVEEEPGVFTGLVPSRRLAGLLVRPQTADGGQGRAEPVSVPVEPEPEYRGAGVDARALAALAAAGGGRVLGPDEDLPRRPVTQGASLAPWLLLLAGLLLLLDRFLRRTQEVTDPEAVRPPPGSGLAT